MVFVEVVRRCASADSDCAAPRTAAGASGNGWLAASVACSLSSAALTDHADGIVLAMGDGEREGDGVGVLSAADVPGVPAEDGGERAAAGIGDGTLAAAAVGSCAAGGSAVDSAVDGGLSSTSLSDSESDSTSITTLADFRAGDGTAMPAASSCADMGIGNLLCKEDGIKPKIGLGLFFFFLDSCFCCVQIDLGILMGNSGAKTLLFGTIKVSGADLYDEVPFQNEHFRLSLHN